MHPTSSDLLLQSLDSAITSMIRDLDLLRAALPVSQDAATKHLKDVLDIAVEVRRHIHDHLPGASWDNRAELESVLYKVQAALGTFEIDEARRKLRSLADELETGIISHRIDRRRDDLKKMRDDAVNELRRGSERQPSPLNIAGPQAPDWLEWAWGLQEPADEVELRALRDDLPAVENFVANLERHMWRAPGTLPKIADSSAIPCKDSIQISTPTLETIDPASLTLLSPGTSPLADDGRRASTVINLQPVSVTTNDLVEEILAKAAKEDGLIPRAELKAALPRRFEVSKPRPRTRFRLGLNPAPL